jgi:type IV secretory pathway VirB6-like protein
MLIKQIIIFFSILLTITTTHIHADWTTNSVSNLMGGALCVSPNSSHPSLNSRMVTMNLPLNPDTYGGWYAGNADAYNGKAMMLNWNFSGASSALKYKMMYSAYGTNQSLYIAKMGSDGRYSWVGNVPGQISSTTNGFLPAYQHTLPINIGTVMHMKTISRADFLQDSASSNWNTQLTPYSGIDPSIGNGFFGSGFDNVLVKTQNQTCSFALGAPTYAGINMSPNISGSNLSFNTTFSARNTYETTINFDVGTKSSVTSFKLLSSSITDHILIKLNGNVIYWYGDFSNSTAPAKNAAYTPSTTAVGDIVYTGAGGWETRYLGPGGGAAWVTGISVGSRSETLTNPVDLKSYLVDGLNTLYVKVLVASNGNASANFQIQKNCTIGTSGSTVPSGISYPDCNLADIANAYNCVFKNGSGVAIKSDSSTNNKTEAQNFSLYNSNYLFQFEPTASGNLSISYPNLSSASNFGLYGHYFFAVETGFPGSVYNTDTKQLSYKICPGSSYCASAPIVTAMDKNYKADAYADGKLWFKIQDPTGAALTGVGQIKVQTYNGTTQYSDFIYDNVILKIQTKLLDASRVLYQNAIINPGTKKVYFSLMTLYLMLYGIYFLLGMVQIKLQDLIIRIFKIVVLSQVFSETSWDFFNKYFFGIFTGGLTYLISSVSGLTSSANNIFGFIDPFMEKLSNDQFWAALAAQIASIHNGLTVIGILVLLGILSFLMGAFEIILTYLISIMGLSVMICMAPLFMVMVLFSRTKPLFDNWVSMLFSNAIQPTITLLLFLVVDQLFETYISRSVVSACMGLYIPMQLHLDFSWIHDGWNITVPLPFFPGIPFLIPDGNGTPDLFTSAILTYIFGKVSLNLSDFSMSITGSLSSVMSSGAGQMLSSVKNDAMGKGV